MYGFLLGEGGRRRGEGERRREEGGGRGEGAFEVIGWGLLMCSALSTGG
jgi:hypothetical protein